MKRRETYIEFIRIIACLLVISVHQNFYLFDFKYKVFTSSCGVLFFMLITGYNLYNKPHKYIKLLKKALLKIVLPGLFIVIFSTLFSDFLLGNSTFLDCINNFYKTMTNSKIEQWYILSGHLWYLKYYFIIIILYPILKNICCNNKYANICRRTIIILFIILILIKDFYNIGIIETYNIKNMDQRILYLYLLLGYELSLKEKILFNTNSKLKNIIFGCILFVIGCIGGFLLSKYGSKYDLFYYGVNGTIPILFSSIGLFIILGNIGLLFKNNHFINYIGNKTFGIYFIHNIVIIKLKSLNNFFISSDIVYSSPFYKKILIETFYILIVFIISFILVIIIKKIIIIFKNIVTKKLNAT